MSSTVPCGQSSTRWPRPSALTLTSTGNWQSLSPRQPVTLLPCSPPGKPHPRDQVGLSYRPASQPECLFTVSSMQREWPEAYRTAAGRTLTSLTRTSSTLCLYTGHVWYILYRLTLSFMKVADRETGDGMGERERGNVDPRTYRHESGTLAGPGLARHLPRPAPPIGSVASLWAARQV